MELSEDVRPPDPVREERLNDDKLDLDDMIARLMSQGLTFEEAREIALITQAENIENSIMEEPVEDQVEELKAIRESEMLKRKQDIEKATKEISSQQDKKLSELEKMVFDVSRRLNAGHLALVNKALDKYKNDKVPMEITDEEFSSLYSELLKMTEIKRLNITPETVDKLMDLFTTPLEEPEGYKYEDEEGEYGGSRRKLKRKNKGKTRKTKRVKKTKRAKRVTHKRYSKRRIYRK